MCRGGGGADSLLYGQSEIFFSQKFEAFSWKVKFFLSLQNEFSTIEEINSKFNTNCYSRKIRKIRSVRVMKV